MHHHPQPGCVVYEIGTRWYPPDPSPAWDADSLGKDWKTCFRSGNSERVLNSDCPDRFPEEQACPGQQLRSKLSDVCAILSTLKGKKCILTCAGSIGIGLCLINCQRQNEVSFN